MDGGGEERRRRKKGGIKIYSESIIKVDEVYAKKLRRRQLPTDECDPEQWNPANVCHVCPMFV